jgi:proline dehydrogenase|tara:strand:+ start:1929 stop:2120 length:192 start_codon:yes stop_codon:yes gene_type:complete
MSFSTDYIVQAIEEARRLTQQVHDNSFDFDNEYAKPNKTVDTLRSVLFKLDVARHAVKNVATN